MDEKVQDWEEFFEPWRKQEVITWQNLVEDKVGEARILCPFFRYFLRIVSYLSDSSLTSNFRNIQ
jgi:IS5 family transposase